MEAIVLNAKNKFALEGLKLLFEMAYENKEVKRTLAYIFTEGMEDSIALTPVKSTIDKHLKDTVSSKWNNSFAMTGEHNPHLYLDIMPLESFKKDGKPFLKRSFEFMVKELKEDETVIPFKVKERSKGFLWYFAYIYKTLLNPKGIKDRSNVIYLLDEPGCYLHASVQKELCKTFVTLGDEGEGNVILYNTHIPYLLTEELLPNLLVAYKTENNINLKKFSQVPESANDAFEPLRTAFGLVPTVLENTKDTCVIVEGLSDFYAFSSVNTADSNIQIIPSTGADNTPKLLSWILSMNKKAIVLLDNDEQGRGVQSKYENIEDFKHLFTLIGGKGDKDKKLEDLFLLDEIQNETKEENITRDSIKYHIPILFKQGKIINMKQSVNNLKSEFDRVVNLITSYQK